MNKRWGAGQETLNNIKLLRDADCIAVVSGQQAGLFTGPLYTIYKALSAVKLAGCLRQRNTKAVPVFWIASEDHDFAEVAMAEFIGRDCQLKQVEVPTICIAKASRSATWFWTSRSSRDRSALRAASHFGVCADMKTLVQKAWQPGRGYGESFATMMTSLLGRHGLDLSRSTRQRTEESRRRSMPQPRNARPNRQLRSNNAAATRKRRISRPGARDRKFFSAFSARRNRRAACTHAWRKRKVPQQKKRHRIHCGRTRAMARETPERFSPNVTLRAVVQDYLLPTIAYYGGAAEIAYFAQTAEVYRLLERPATPILPRSSLTMIERHTGRVLERYGLTLADFFEGPEP